MSFSGVFSSLEDAIKASFSSNEPDDIRSTVKAYFDRKDRGLEVDPLLLRIDVFLSQYIENKSESLRSIETSLENSDKLLNKITLNLAQIKEDVSNSNETARTTKAYVDDVHSAVQGFKDSVAEELKLKDATRLWEKTSFLAGISYWSSFLLIVSLLLAPTALAYFQPSVIAQFFQGSYAALIAGTRGTTSQDFDLIFRFISVSLPILLYLWLIRLVVKYNARSLLLMDDANQRSTILSTYLRLVSDDSTVKSERPLLLEALFRRTPGHGPETIEPPSLSEVIKLTHRP